MRVIRIAYRLVLAGLCLALPAAAQPARPYWYAWSPRPDAATPYRGVNRPVWRLAEVLAAHKGQANWSQEIIHTDRYTARWIQMAPGVRTRPQFYGDDRVVWVVWSGQVRFTIAGQEPFVAKKGFLVQVPYRVAYSMETVGAEPSLRFEVTHTGRLPSYPADASDTDRPTAPKGMHYEKVTYPSPPDAYTALNPMKLDFFQDVVAARPNDPPEQHYFVNDGDNMVDILRGRGMPTPPPTNRGHFHVGYDEFWFVLEGRIEYLIEGQQLLSALPGDVVLAAPGRWHRAAWAGEGMATRLAFNERSAMLHNYGEHAEGRQR